MLSGNVSECSSQDILKSGDPDLMSRYQPGVANSMTTSQAWWSRPYKGTGSTGPYKGTGSTGPYKDTGSTGPYNREHREYMERPIKCSCHRIDRDGGQNPWK